MCTCSMQKVIGVHKAMPVLFLEQTHIITLPDLGNIVGMPPSPSFLLGEGAEPPTKFSKMGGLTGPQL